MSHEGKDDQFPKVDIERRKISFGVGLFSGDIREDFAFISSNIGGVRRR